MAHNTLHRARLLTTAALAGLLLVPSAALAGGWADQVPGYVPVPTSPGTYYYVAYAGPGGSLCEELYKETNGVPGLQRAGGFYPYLVTAGPDKMVWGICWIHSPYHGGFRDVVVTLVVPMPTLGTGPPVWLLVDPCTAWYNDLVCRGLQLAWPDLRPVEALAERALGLRIQHG